MKEQSELKLIEFDIESPCNGCKPKNKIECEYCNEYNYYAINRAYMQKQMIIDQKVVDALQSRIKEQEDIISGFEKTTASMLELIPTKEEAEALLLALESYMFCVYGTKKLPEWAAKLKKIAGMK